MVKLTRDDTALIPDPAPQGVSDMGQADFVLDDAGANRPEAGAIKDPLSLPANWTPHRPDRPEKSEGGKRFEVVSEYEPTGDQPQAIQDLVDGVH